MKFEELLDRYKNGIATEEERILVKEELEKYLAIEEHLADTMDLDLDMGLEDNQYRDESIKIKKSVSSKLRNVVLASVVIMTALIIGVFFIISPLVDSLHYNPTKITVGEDEHDIHFDMVAINELNYPGYTLSSLVDVDRKGFGEYNISYFRSNLFTQETSHVYSNLKRNLHMTNHTLWTNESSFSFKTISLPDEIFDAEDALDQKNRVMNHLAQLSPVSYTSSWLTFEDDLSMEEVYQLMLDYPEVNFAWVGIRIASVDELIHDFLGFSTRSYKLTSDKPDPEKYPAFYYLEWLVNPTDYDWKSETIEAKGYELHFKDLLRYVIDRKDAINILESRPSRHEYYEKALDYVEENGVKSYGVLAYANAEDLIDLVENEEILTLELNQVMASKRFVD